MTDATTAERLAAVAAEDAADTRLVQAMSAAEDAADAALFAALAAADTLSPAALAALAEDAPRGPQGRDAGAPGGAR